MKQVQTINSGMAKGRPSRVNPVVEAVAQLKLSGPVVPGDWLRHPIFRYNQTDSQRKSGRETLLNLPAIVVLADIISWYRPRKNDKHITSTTRNTNQRFAGHRLQIDYSTCAKRLGLTKRQVQGAVAFLVDRSLIVREVCATTTTTGVTVGSAVFVEPVVDKIRQLSCKLEPIATTDEKPVQQPERKPLNPEALKADTSEEEVVTTECESLTTDTIIRHTTDSGRQYAKNRR